MKIHDINFTFKKKSFVNIFLPFTTLKHVFVNPLFICGLKRRWWISILRLWICILHMQCRVLRQTFYQSNWRSTCVTWLSSDMLWTGGTKEGCRTLYMIKLHCKKTTILTHQACKAEPHLDVISPLNGLLPVFINPWICVSRGLLQLLVGSIHSGDNPWKLRHHAGNYLLM